MQGTVLFVKHKTSVDACFLSSVIFSQMNAPTCQTHLHFLRGVSDGGYTKESLTGLALALRWVWLSKLSIADGEQRSTIVAV